MASRTRGVILLLLCTATAACSSPDPGAFMATIDVPRDGTTPDGSIPDGSTADSTTSDVSSDQTLPSDGDLPSDGSTTDALVSDGGPDSGQPDVATDGNATDTTPDVATPDATPDAIVADVTSDTTPRDGSSPDVAADASVDSAPDVARDVAADSTPTDAPRDVASTDVATDAPPTDSGCPGAAPVVTVTAPTADEMIETCTVSGVPLYYDFRANVTTSASVRSVTAEWRLPSGSLAPPSPPPLSAPPYTWRRQVGGAMTAGGIPPLSILDGAMRGTWHFEVTATDSCGRSTMVSQPFTLLYTMIRRCPNP